MATSKICPHSSAASVTISASPVLDLLPTVSTVQEPELGLLAASPVDSTARSVSLVECVLSVSLMQIDWNH